MTSLALTHAVGAAAPRLEWQRWEDIPDTVGRKGMYGGVSEGHVLLAGGSNFPVPPSAGGKKMFHRDVFVRRLPLSRGEPWQVAKTTLPAGCGEGATVTTVHGVICIGGHDGSAPLASVFLLRWDRVAKDIELRPLPSLPESVANAAAALADGWLYVAGGEGTSGARRTFWRLDLGAAIARPQAVQWQRLPAWPGAPRFGGILISMTGPAGPSLLLFAGLPGAPKGAGDYLREALRFEARTLQWSPRAEMPRGAVLGAAVPVDDRRVLVLGGSDGHDFERMRELGDRYRIPADVLIYDAAADQWGRAGAMPLGLVGASVIDVGDGWLVAGGEYSPGRRTAQVHQLRIGER